MMRFFLPIALFLAATISGCGQSDEFDQKDSIATDLKGITHDPKADRPTTATTRLDELRASHGRTGPVSK